MKKSISIFAFLILFGMSFPAFAGWFGEDTAVLLKILGEQVIQNKILVQSLGVAKQKLGVLENFFSTFRKVFGDVDLPHDYVPWEEGTLSDLSFPRDPRLEQIFETIRSAKDVFTDIRDLSLKDILHGRSLEDLVATIQNTWDLQFNLPEPKRNKQDAITTLLALHSLDASRRTLPLLPDMTTSLEDILPEVNRATPGRALQLNTHLNFLQTAGLQHLLENQAATTQMAATDLLNKQEETKSNVKATMDAYSALSDVVSSELKQK